MNKIQYYGKRAGGQTSYNYNSTYNYPYKKNYYKNRNKQNNIRMNNYFEARKKNYYYYNESPNSYSYSQKTYHPQRYDSHYTEENLVEEMDTNDTINEEEKNDELLRIRVNLNENDYKELIICKNDVIYKKVEEFCNNNNINKKLIDPLYNKINQSLNTIRNINNNLNLNNNDLSIINKYINNNIDNSKNNIN